MYKILLGKKISFYSFSQQQRIFYFIVHLKLSLHKQELYFNVLQSKFLLHYKYIGTRVVFWFFKRKITPKYRIA
jgi:hypothetical protein